ncbi:cysteine synthase A [Mesoaciditoga lauensis]|uniref:cysteine synthase A n=1 Tax=Mesoaciditoga lauensis TaxID=1495039 RepID=UPI00055C318B|nr:cysteine synthase A [Mesoaciditoga lauensis]
MNLTTIITRTPMVRLKTNDSIWLKLEKFNPGGSVKDRTVLSMITDAFEKGIISQNSTIVEATSGNTGIAMAMLGAYYGLHVVLTMPESLSIERRKILSSYGAEVILTSSKLGMKGAVERAKEVANSTHGIMLDQFNNPANPRIHFATTGPEIFSQLPQIDAFVAGIGTGGTLTGVGRFLKQVSEKIKIFAVEPAESPVLSGGKPSKHGIQGIGAGFIPANYDPSLVCDVITVSTSEAWEITRFLAKREGLFLGISSGAATAAAMKVSKKLGRNSKIAVIAPDGGEKYLSVW